MIEEDEVNEFLCPERIDALGRVIPAVRATDMVADIKAGVTSRQLAAILARCEDVEVYNLLVGEAVRAGHTHYPPDLAGRASPLRFQ